MVTFLSILQNTKLVPYVPLALEIIHHNITTHNQIGTCNLPVTKDNYKLNNKYSIEHHSFI